MIIRLLSVGSSIFSNSDKSLFLIASENLNWIGEITQDIKHQKRKASSIQITGMHQNTHKKYFVIAGSLLFLANISYKNAVFKLVILRETEITFQFLTNQSNCIEALYFLFQLVEEYSRIPFYSI